MSVGVVLGPNPFWQFTDNQGKFASFGKVKTLDWNTRAPKPTFRDPGQTIEWPNPIPLDSIGRVREIFLQDDAPYYLELYDAKGGLIWSTDQPYVPGGGGSGPVNNQFEFKNLIINGQFEFYPIQQYSPIPNEIDFLADPSGKWRFRKNGTNTTDSLSFKKYTLDNTQISPPATTYLNYVSTNPGVGETYKDLGFIISDVKTLSNEQVTIGANLRSAIAGTYSVEVLIRQNFGTGGTPSPEVITSLFNLNLTGVPQNLSNTALIPSLIGKTLGTNGDDYIEIIFRFPLNSIANIEITNVYWCIGNDAISYPYETPDEEDAAIKALELPRFNRNTEFQNDTYNYYDDDQAYNVMTLIPKDGLVTQTYLPAVPTGSITMWLLTTAPFGWEMLNGQSVIKVGKYARLYNTTDGNGNKFGGRWGIPTTNITDSTSNLDLPATQFAAAAVKLGGSTSADATIGTTSFTLSKVSNAAVTGIIGNTVTGDEANFTNQNVGAFSPPALDKDTGMTITIISNGTATTPSQWKIKAKPANSLTAGTYFNITSPAAAQIVYLVIDGNGTDPNVPGRISRPLYLNSTDNDVVVAWKIFHVVSGYACSIFNVQPAINIIPGSYLQFNLESQVYLYWFRKGGSGIAPSVGGAINVPIDILETDTAAQVAFKIRNAFPLLWFLPDARGYVPRAWNNGSGRDPDAANRTSQNPGGITGDFPGTVQDFQVQSHTHQIDNVTAFTGDPGTRFLIENVNAPFTGNITTTAAGGSETRPLNMSFAFIIKL